MSLIKLMKERDWLLLLLKDFERDATGQQGGLDRISGEDRKRHLISRIALIDAKIAGAHVQSPQQVEANNCGQHD